MFNLNTLPMSFLGANTASGFVSRFADSYSAEDGWHAYIIKGGPGTGKSSLMKQAAAVLAEAGNEVEICPCSSDPDSLDGVVIKNKKTVILDGTAPHTLDPQYPGVCEQIVNLGECWDSEKFCGHLEKIISVSKVNREFHRHASRYIMAAGQLMTDSFRIALSCTDTPRTADFAAGLAGRLIAVNGKTGTERKRFLTGITPAGLVFYRSTITKICDTVIAVEDPYGVVSGVMMGVIREMAITSGCDIITCYSCFDADKIDHIIIPSMKLAFCTENRFMHPTGITRRIHARRFMNAAAIAKHKQRISFNRKAADELLREAVIRLNDAKSAHDELESFYINAMNFEKVGEIGKRIIEEINDI